MQDGKDQRSVIGVKAYKYERASEPRYIEFVGLGHSIKFFGKETSKEFDNTPTSQETKLELHLK